MNIVNIHHKRFANWEVERFLYLMDSMWLLSFLSVCHTYLESVIVILRHRY